MSEEIYIQESASTPVPAMSRRNFLRGAAIASSSLLMEPKLTAAQEKQESVPQAPLDPTLLKKFPNEQRARLWERYSFSTDRWWGQFSHELPDQMDMFADHLWAVGPFIKYAGNPLLTPTPGAWDQGAFSGGVHNGSIVVKDGIFYYVYRGHRPIDVPMMTKVDYICDIGVATSKDGIHFVKDTKHSPFFRKGEDRRYSYEDVNVVRYGDTYYLFCNQWLWSNQKDLSINGLIVATSKDLLNWTKHGIVFPNAKEVHRNGIVLQSPHNEAVRVDGKFVMYLDNGLIAYSTDMLHWESHRNPNVLPGGESCFALADYNPERPDDIIYFSGGAHTGHFYAVGEILLSKKDPEKPIAWLPRSPLFAETKYPFENGFSVDDPDKAVSSFADCIFFNALTLHNGKWWLYYGPANYYTCLATAPARHANI